MSRDVFFLECILDCYLNSKGIKSTYKNLAQRKVLLIWGGFALFCRQPSLRVPHSPSSPWREQFQLGDEGHPGVPGEHWSHCWAPEEMFHLQDCAHAQSWWGHQWQVSCDLCLLWGFVHPAGLISSVCAGRIPFVLCFIHPVSPVWKTWIWDMAWCAVLNLSGACGSVLSVVRSLSSLEGVKQDLYWQMGAFAFC